MKIVIEYDEEHYFFDDLLDDLKQRLLAHNEAWGTKSRIFMEDSQGRKDSESRYGHEYKSQAARDLHPGDLIQVDGELGVVSKACVVISGSNYNWNQSLPHGAGNYPSYAVEWRSPNSLRNAWWSLSELSVVSLGPFH